MIDKSILNIQPPFDKVLIDIANYVINYEIKSELAYQTAYYCLIDSIGCGLEALFYPQCKKLLGNIIPGIAVPNGAKVFGTSFQLDPIQAAFNMGTMIRWLDYNDTWLAAEWGHPSDNLGAILAVSDWISRAKVSNGKQPFLIKDILTAMIKAYEIQGIMALENSFNRVGLDHVILVKLASTAVTCQLLELSFEQTLNALSQVFIDGQPLRTYRHAPNTGSRKSWAAGDATARGVRLALLAKSGEMGYPSVLTAKKWGFYDVSFQGEEFKFSRDYGSYVIENILFKVSFPAEFHAQTAVEGAIKLHEQVKNKLDFVKKVTIRTHESALRIIDKKGILRNPADRDHCMQYMVAISLIFGRLTANDYEENTATDLRIDTLRAKIECIEDKQFTKDYLAADKRSIANAIKIEFDDGSSLEEVVNEYPLGHKFRRKEGIPLLTQKFKTHLEHYYGEKSESLFQMMSDYNTMENMAIHELMNLLEVESII